MDVIGLSYAEYSDAEREAVVHAHPRTARFKEDISQAVYDGIKHKPETLHSVRPKQGWRGAYGETPSAPNMRCVAYLSPTATASL
jgi:hypothetical protein